YFGGVLVTLTAVLAAWSWTHGTLGPPFLGPRVQRVGEALSWLGVLGLVVLASGDLVQAGARRRCGECRVEGGADVHVTVPLADLRERWVTPHGVRVDTGRRRWRSRTLLPLLIPTRGDAESAQVLTLLEAHEPPPA
ncbi:MAG: hypothetical protein KIT58_19215, partial [Planctomycetota bacterium]|nr:hypothetical protein [Planctomycetota bacterium]